MAHLLFWHDQTKLDSTSCPTVIDNIATLFLLKQKNEKLSPLLMTLEVTCTRHMHESHHEVLWGKVLAYTSALLSSSLKTAISPLVILEVPITPQLPPTPAPVETPTVSAKPLIVHTVLKAVETCTAQHVACCSIKWVTFAAYNRSFIFFFFFFKCTSAEKGKRGR